MSRRALRALPALLVLMSLAASCEMGSKSISVTSVPAPSPAPSPVVNCSGGPYSILVSWTANREKAVNITGGGYLVYYSTSSPVNTSTASSVTVP